VHPIETFEHSKKTAEKLAQLLSIPPPLAQKLITDKVTDSYHKFTNASGDDQANMVGEGVGDVLQIFVGSGEVKGLLQAVKIVKLADESIPVIKIIEEGAEASGIAEDAAKTGCRLGNGATRGEIENIAAELKSRGYTITGGGGIEAEEYLKPLGAARKGGSYLDITATHPKYPTFRVNTVDVLKDGITPTSRELRNAIRIRSQIAPGEHLLLIPKR
jgi:hypothetical protein